MCHIETICQCPSLSLSSVLFPYLSLRFLLSLSCHLFSLSLLPSFHSLSNSLTSVYPITPISNSYPSLFLSLPLPGLSLPLHFHSSVSSLSLFLFLTLPSYPFFLSLPLPLSPLSLPLHSLSLSSIRSICMSSHSLSVTTPLFLLSPSSYFLTPFVSFSLPS